jgi:release factor glutamine methyltransferase
LNTYNDVFLSVRKRLADSDVSSASIEARLLIMKASGKSKEELMRDMRLYVGAAFEGEVEALLKRRLQGEPIAYIIGEWEFYGIGINVTPDVLIPRTDTEVLVTAALEALEGVDAPRILDLCCGSGCVGIAIAKNAPSCRAVLVDNSPAALSVARSNIIKNKQTNFIMCVEADACDPPPVLLGKFDLIACNPPYIPSLDIAKLDRSVAKYEPAAALDGGSDGLDIIRAAARSWGAVLKDGGRFFIEIGIGQAQAVRDIMAENNYEDIKTYFDTQNIERVISGKIKY